MNYLQALAIMEKMMLSRHNAPKVSQKPSTGHSFQKTGTTLFQRSCMTSISKAVMTIKTATTLKHPLKIFSIQLICS